MADDDSSDLSSLSSLSPPPADIDDEVEVKPDKQGILKYLTKTKPEDAAASRKTPPPRKREQSPPHDFVFADNEDIAVSRKSRPNRGFFIVMFRKRFDSAMPRSLAHFGPLELEEDIKQEPPAERVEHFLCVVLGLLLNRKQDIKIGHYNKALGEDAVSGATFKTQWPRHWTENPLQGGTFHTITPEKRLDLLKTLTVWALGHSDAIKALINSSYTGKRTNDDLNQPLSVQPWGVDSDKRRYYLIEGDDSCSFRVYRESNPAALYNRQWISVAGSIDEVKALAEKLATADGGPNARKLSSNIHKNIPNFEEKEEKRRRREYRRQQKERFRRPEPGFSIYEGRTRGKRVKYTFSDEEDFQTDSTNRRSTRNTRNHSPVETGPVVTASGRQSRPPARLNANADALSNGGVSGAPSVQGDAADTEMSEPPEVGPTGRPRRSAATHQGTNSWAQPRKRRRDYVSDEEEDESEPDLGDDEEEDHIPQDETDDEEEFENDAMDEDDNEIAADSPGSNDSRVVKLPIKVKFDKNGRVRRLLNDEDTPSASTPSNMVSSPSAVGEQSEDSPSDYPTYEPRRTEDVVNVMPLKATPETTLKDDGASQANSTLTPTSHPSAPSTPLGGMGVSPTLAFRGSPEKAQPLPRVVASADLE
ncbi:hypothetical protein M406DRAFT_246005 [Cryphonectria parasitica EP155]|uniref:WHIM1 domain-containing protein n=1 Tax=Cryphonectria parasitica (strain ATCC 38755 / EP155) TaxID=660469 RepID=A0A9P4YC69_CRYP1|nr:uncharacterized protein M406DRAFT_246005 [Cryphonectria parasitica EP155]KAF3770393.1 hypothetical protein M406DRAFT_246005 [Cryphonectria parasitica EP155]